VISPLRRDVELTSERAEIKAEDLAADLPASEARVVDGKDGDGQVDRSLEATGVLSANVNCELATDGDSTSP